MMPVIDSNSTGPSPGGRRGFVPFRLLSFAQAKEAIALRPKWNPLELHRFAFWIKKDGHVSRRNGRHELTKEEGAKIDAMLRGAIPPSKDWDQR